MKHTRSVRFMSVAAAVAAAFLEQSAPAGATQTDIAPAPLGTAPTVTVLPNLMFILDDSGSMARDFMPDEVDDGTSCKSCSTSTCNVANTSCQAGHPPYYAAQFNTVYYNPQIRYKPGVDSTGASLGNANPNNALDDPYSGSPSAKDSVTKWTDVVWCNTSAPTTAQLSDANVCKKNGLGGLHGANPFTYNTTTNTAPFSGGLPVATGTSNTTFRFPFNVDGNPFYYEITPREHCTNENLTDCTLSATPTGSFIVPAPVRWCRSSIS